jgi:hypothetical protein
MGFSPLTRQRCGPTLAIGMADAAPFGCGGLVPNDLDSGQRRPLPRARILPMVTGAKISGFAQPPATNRRGPVVILDKAQRWAYYSFGRDSGFMEPTIMRRWLDLIDSKPFSAVFVGGLSLGTFALMDYDWHAVALSLLAVAGYWLSFRKPLAQVPTSVLLIQASVRQI